MLYDKYQRNLVLMLKCYLSAYTSVLYPLGGFEMTTVTQMKCACPNCLCIVSIEDAINKDGKYYCSEGCAEGHQTIKGCKHNGCGC